LSEFVLAPAMGESCAMIIELMRLRLSAQNLGTL